jgi:hypothetical protein
VIAADARGDPFTMLHHVPTRVPQDAILTGTFRALRRAER